MKLRQDLILRKVGKDHIIVEPGQGKVDMSKVYTLNETAAWIWEEVQGQEFTEQTIVELFLENYEVSLEQAQQDAEKLVKIFREYKLLQN